MPRRRTAPEKLDDAALLARAIAETQDERGAPITDAAFAETVLHCHPRTLRKYLTGRPLPSLAREKLVGMLRAQ